MPHVLPPSPPSPQLGGRETTTIKIAHRPKGRVRELLLVVLIHTRIYVSCFVHQNSQYSQVILPSNLHPSGSFSKTTCRTRSDHSPHSKLSPWQFKRIMCVARLLFSVVEHSSPMAIGSVVVSTSKEVWILNTFTIFKEPPSVCVSNVFVPLWHQ